MWVLATELGTFGRAAVVLLILKSLLSSPRLPIEVFSLTAQSEVTTRAGQAASPVFLFCIVS